MPRINKNIKKRYDGKRFYSSPNLPVIQQTAQDIYIIANESTRLDVLAYEYYRDASYWWIIAKANNIGFGYSVEAGKQIRIPTNIERYI
jgi:hypothetical protein